jgi:hypothetical protein
MIKDSRHLLEFERSLIRSTKPDWRKNLEIANALIKEAQSLGVFPPKNPLEGLDIDIKFAKAINSVQTTPRKNRLRAR